MNSAERAELAEDIAVRLVELLREDALPTGNKPLSVAQVAEALGRSHDWVRDHRDELGVIGTSGKKPRLMFDAAKVREAMTARGAETPELPKPTERRHRRRQAHAADLLPIRGRAA